MIVNLQKTPKDKKASLVIHSKVDHVMQQVMERAGFEIPDYNRYVSFKSVCTEQRSSSNGEICLQVTLKSLDDQACSPLIASAEFNTAAGYEGAMMSS